MNILFIKYLMIISLLVGYLPVKVQDNPAGNLVTLSEQECPFRDVIDKISFQANVFFVFDDVLVSDRKISCIFNAEPVNKVIDYIANQAGLFFECINNNTFVFYKNNKENYPYTSSKTNRVNNGLGMRKGIVSPPERKITQLPDYPALAKQKNIEGDVYLNLLINKTGKVEKVQVIKSSGHEILDNAAIDYSKEIIFEPAKKGDTTIATWYPINFNYKLLQSDVSPNNYVTSILNYYAEMKDISKEEQKDLLTKILNTHIQYLTRFSNEEVNINYYLDKIINPSLKSGWEDFRVNKSFYFLVFHDFIQRSSYEELNNQAKSYLVKFLLKELHNESNLSFNKQDLFNRNVYTLLEKNYPELINQVFREEVGAH